MPWFRKKKSKEEQAPAEAAAPEAPPEEQAARPKSSEEAGKAPARRRRGTRGGRGRKKKAEEPKAPVAEKKKEEAPRPRRRRTPAKLPQLPPVKKEIVISVEVGEDTVAVLEDGKPAEVYLGRPSHRSIAGNIYKGVVDNVLPGMEASFVDIGLEKNGFLYVDEIVVPELESRRQGRKIQELISRGEEVLVQAVKDPMGTKGARLTTEISLPGRFLVYTPFGDGIGVSRRLEDAERERLKGICKSLELPEGGIIVRTAAEGASEAELTGDLKLLVKLWATIKGRAGRAEPPTLVYQEAELPLRIIRDLFISDFERVIVDHERTYRRIVGYLKRTSPVLAARVERYTGKEPLMEKAGVRQAVRSTLDRRVDLPSGGYLIFDYAEAFTVIDVNTGRFVGSRSKSSGARLEDTITANNLEAVKEVVHQLRLRDIGGIIVIDFIDMANPKNRATVEEALKKELERDRTKTYVVEISPLGLVEMTRQNVTDGPREVMTRKCSVCAGDGVVLADTTVAVDVERRLRQLATGSRVQAFRVAINPRTLHLLAGPGGERLAALEAQTRRRFFVESAEGTELDHLEVLAHGKLEELRPQGPVSEGEELEVKLVEVGLHDSGAAVAKLDGYEIAVADAARLVGKKVRVRVERVLNGTAFATRLDATPQEQPITAEAEAEKPTRQPRARKVAVEAPEEKVEAADAPAVGEAAPAEDAPEAEGEGQEAPKKRTRRGSRGGRGRKKTTPGAETEAAAETSGGPAETATADAEKPKKVEKAEKAEKAEQPEPPAPPRIHVPDDELSRSLPESDAAEPQTEGEPEVAAAGETDGAQPAKKRTRRGSRGGRGRKKKPTSTEASANGDGAVEAVADEPEPEPEPAPEPAAQAAQPGDPDWEYTPMSEWGDEFGRPR